MSDRYQEHLAERTAQNYSSTRLWVGNPNRSGMAGERELSVRFGYPHEMINKPGGDGGVDRELLLISKLGARWVQVDVKASTTGYLLVDVEKIKSSRLYILAEYNRDDDSAELAGWEWGRDMMGEPSKRWNGNEAIVHYKPNFSLRDMGELFYRFTGWSRDALSRKPIKSVSWGW